MLNLIYNIDFELTALLFAVLLFAETMLNYPKNTKKNRIFRIMTITVIVTEVFDVLSAFTNTYGDRIPSFLNIIINTLFFAFGILLCYIFHYYIQYSIVPPGGKIFLIKSNKVVLIIMELCYIPNAFFGFFFYFNENGEYTHGILYLAAHLISLWFVICASVSLIINRRLLKAKQMSSGFTFITLYLIAVILQTFVFPDVLLIMVAVSAMLIIAIFTLESPDYVQLQNALRELTETKKELELANEKYIALAYRDDMTGLENRAAYNARLEKLGAMADKDYIFLMADVNNLKLLNDSYGHLVGDEAIILTARLIKENFTDGCKCYRIGGDEFAVIAHGISPEAFANFYDRFTAGLEAEREKADYPFSVASGYQTSDDHTLFEALRLADKKMYKNKASGRSAPQTAPDTAQ